MSRSSGSSRSSRGSCSSGSSWSSGSSGSSRSNRSNRGSRSSRRSGSSPNSCGSRSSRSSRGSCSSWSSWSSGSSCGSRSSRSSRCSRSSRSSRGSLSVSPARPALLPRCPSVQPSTDFRSRLKSTFSLSVPRTRLPARPARPHVKPQPVAAVFAPQLTDGWLASVAMLGNSFNRNFQCRFHCRGFHFLASFSSGIDDSGSASDRPDGAFSAIPSRIRRTYGPVPRPDPLSTARFHCNG